MITTSEELKDLATALAKAQGQIIDAKRDQEAHTYNYANLAQVLQILRPAFSENELSLVQMPGISEEGHATLTTRLMHSSGQWMEGEMEMAITIPLSNDGKELMSPAQAAGSVITYMRRYVSSAVAGISQEDDDAEPKEGSKTHKAAHSKSDDDKPWYNGVEQDKEAIIGAMIGGKNAKVVVGELRERYKVSKKTFEIIEGYEKEARTTG